MAHVEIAHGSYFLDDGRCLLSDVNFRLGDGDKIALIGPNGAGKTTLMRILAQQLPLHEGTRSHSGLVGMMDQFIGHVRDASTVRDLLLLASRPELQAAARRVDESEERMLIRDDDASKMAYAQAVIDWGDAGGYDEENRWGSVAQEALGLDFDRASSRLASSLSGGEQKRLVLQALASGPHNVLLLDEPDNYLDVPGKRWLEDMLRSSSKTVLFISHDREVVSRAATGIATLEKGPNGASVWVHGGSFATYHQARDDRHRRVDELRRRWNEDEQKLLDLVAMYKTKAAYNSDMASRYQAAKTRLARFRSEGAPDGAPIPEVVRMNLVGGRTAKRAVICESLELTGLMAPFDAEFWFGDRIAVLGSNGSGKSHFLRLLAQASREDDERDAGALSSDSSQYVRHSGTVRLGARVRAGFFAQTHTRPDLDGKTLLEILGRGDDRRDGLDRQGASGILGRYGLVKSAEQRFETLSGGQQARLQILLLELEGATLLLLDEPTDNLDLESAEALEHGLAGFAGTVVAVTHDRWFARSFDRFVVFRADGAVVEADAPVWDERRVVRPG